MARGLKNNQSLKGPRGKALLVLGSVGLASIIYGAYNIWQVNHYTHNPHPTVNSAIITKVVTKPQETAPTDACDNYRVAALQPKRIDISNIGAHGCMERVGINNDGAIAAPDNIYTAAWYIKSVPPGQPGLSIILGHISGRNKIDGIFQHLVLLKPGDTFTVTRGDGTILSYEVLNKQSVPTEQSVQVLLSKQPNVSSQLNLITCGGNYNKDTKLYDHRIIVSAKLNS